MFLRRAAMLSPLLLLAAGLMACGGGGSGSPPQPKPTISSFAATPSAMTPGSSSTLAWSVTGATSVSIDQGVGTVSGTSVTVAPTATTTYTLTATNSSGTTAATVTVSVGPAPLIASFVATPSWVTTGQSSKLVWSVNGARGLAIDQGVGTVTSTSAPVTPTADTTYTLTASNQFGSTTASASLAVFQPPTVWFAPDNFLFNGSVDYLDLFNSSAPWAQAASHVRVFKLYQQMVGSLPDADLSKIFTDLKRRHIALAFEFGPLTPDGCGDGIEGFAGVGAVQFAQRIRDLGGSPQYIAFDEPYQHASDLNTCHWTPTQVAQNAAQSVAQIRSIFPDVIFGDIEAVPPGDTVTTWLDGYQQWVDAWQATTGTPFAFFDFDVGWDGDWKPAVAALARALKLRHIPIGQIYIGSPSAGNDSDWATSAEQRITELETHGGPIADQLIFQSWEYYPKHLLPESDPTTFTHQINRYYRTRTAMAATISSRSIQGQLTAQGSGSPVANAALTVTATPLSGAGQQATYSTAGTIPLGTQFVTFGIRAGTECGWPLPAAFSVSNFTLDAGPAGAIGADFTNQLAGWSVSGSPSVIQVNNGILQVVVKLGESLNMDPAPIPFSAVGMPYMFSVNATVPSGSRGNACFISIFQNATAEFSRVVIPLRPQPISVGSVQTAADGRFSVDLGTLPPVNLQLWVYYAGSDTLWPAAAGIAVGNAPSLSVTTASLSAGTVGTAYSQPLIATGGFTPYLWVGSGLPPGLLLHQDGTVSGTPKTAGSYTVSVSVVDDSDPPQIVDLSLPIMIQ